eukprot:m.29601 g.29601  ORF g.29601 m.29601 type:complete len:304 (+) comp12126_c0_seq1:28-939(+)
MMLSSMGEMSEEKDALYFIPNIVQMVRVVLLILVVAEGSGAAENPSKIVWVALMYLVFCLLGTLDAYALRNDMLTSGGGGDFSNFIRRVHSERSMLSSALGMALGRLGPVVFSMCIICIDQYETHTFLLQLAIILDVLSHWLYTNATLGAASEQGYVDHKPLKQSSPYGADVDDRFGPKGTPWALRQYYQPAFCGMLTACSETFLITLYMLADPKLSARSTSMLQVMNKICTVGVVIRLFACAVQLFHSVLLLIHLDLAIRNGQDSRRGTPVIRERSGPRQQREFGGFSPKPKDGKTFTFDTE